MYRVMTTDTAPTDLMILINRPDTTVAVVGANDNPSKYGNRIYRNLKAKGITVFGVNPYRDEVDGDRCYRSLADLPEAPTIVDFVIPPARTLEVLAECRELGYTEVWIQPGAEDDAVIAYLEEHDFNHLVDECIMVEAHSRA